MLAGKLSKRRRLAISVDRSLEDVSVVLKGQGAAGISPPRRIGQRTATAIKTTQQPRLNSRLTVGVGCHCGCLRRRQSTMHAPTIARKQIGPRGWKAMAVVQSPCAQQTKERSIPQPAQGIPVNHRKAQRLGRPSNDLPSPVGTGTKKRAARPVHERGGNRFAHPRPFTAWPRVRSGGFVV